MNKSIWPLVISVWLMCSIAEAYADEPKKPAVEQLPAPREILPAPKQFLPAPAPKEMIVPPVIILPPRPHPGTREGWQYYGVDSFGRFRPRVILAPAGSYYYGTLQPYPWIPNRSARFMPYVLD